MANVIYLTVLCTLLINKVMFNCRTFWICSLSTWWIPDYSKGRCFSSLCCKWFVLSSLLWTKSWGKFRVYFPKASINDRTWLLQLSSWRSVFLHLSCQIAATAVCDCIGNPLEANVSPSAVIVSLLYLVTPAPALIGAHHRVTFFSHLHVNSFISLTQHSAQSVLHFLLSWWSVQVLHVSKWLLLSNGKFLKASLINAVISTLDQKTVCSVEGVAWSDKPADDC